MKVLKLIKSFAMGILPNAGLGNKMFVWARVLTFAHLNDVDWYVIGWSYPRFGPILRRENRDIFYGRHLKAQPIPRKVRILKVGLMRWNFEPAIENHSLSENTVYIFSKTPHWSDMFGSLHSQRLEIINAFDKILKDHVKERINKLPPPVIGIHVRRGDFRELRESESFSKVGGVRTPIDYFIDLIVQIRNCAGWLMPVTVFSDGTDTELRKLLAVSNVKRAPELPDIGHMLLMSRSSIIVASAGSTFSMWAGFLSEGILILHPDHIHAPIRPFNTKWYEGPANGCWRAWRADLINQIQSVKRCHEGEYDESERP